MVLSGPRLVNEIVQSQIHHLTWEGGFRERTAIVEGHLGEAAVIGAPPVDGLVGVGGVYEPIWAVPRLRMAQIALDDPAESPSTDDWLQERQTTVGAMRQPSCRSLSSDVPIYSISCVRLPSLVAYISASLKIRYPTIP